jgi:regulatory factor X, other
VVPLNPASFGKLVRVIFPGIQTRRLGVRGESKYHYVDLALEEENPNVPYSNGYHPEIRPRSQSASTQHIDFNNIPRLQADTAAFPTEGSFDFSPTQPPTPRGPASIGQAFAQPEARGMQAGSVESMTYPHTLRFPSSNLPVFAENEPVNLPPIHPYLPPRTDNDTAEALFALYRTHCTSLIDSIRFCKEKQFFRLYTSFHGTLTVPVQKLFTHPNLAPWIEQCDLVMYRTMVRFVSRLTLQAAPVNVINIFSNISSSLHPHISKTFANQPPHVLDAKLRPATVFAGLLYRLIRVNQSAHAAANLLTIDFNREQMWREWVSMVNPKRVMEAELPDCGYEEVYKILTAEMRGLLEPLQAPAYDQDPYSFQAYNFDENGGFAAFLQSSMQPSRNGASTVSTENVLDRWSAFIASLPSRFPHAPTRTLLHCISSVGTAALRDITIGNGASYSHWWVLKIFVDEMALWLAEMGGFLEPTSHAVVPATNGGSQYQSPVLENEREQLSRSQTASSRGVSMGADVHSAPASAGVENSFNMQNPEVAMDFQRAVQAHSLPFAQPGMEKHDAASADIDDSGIGMSLVEDDFTTTGRSVGVM